MVDLSVDKKTRHRLDTITVVIAFCILQRAEYLHSSSGIREYKRYGPTKVKKGMKRDGFYLNETVVDFNRSLDVCAVQ